MMEITRDNQGREVWVSGGPLRGLSGVKSRFGPRTPIQTPAGWTGDFHYGVDLNDDTNEIIARFGAVKIVANVYTISAGNFLRVQLVSGPCQGWLLEYFHLDRQSPHALNLVVGPNTTLGISGATGMATGEHLHFQVRKPSWELVDPLGNEFVTRVNGGQNMPETYTVKSGDTFAGIAAQFNIANWRDLYVWNGLPSSFPPQSLQVGTVLKVSAPDPDPTPDPDPEPDPTPDPEPNPTPGEETNSAKLVRATATIAKVARDLTTKASILHNASREAEEAALAIAEGER